MNKKLAILLISLCSLLTSKAQQNPQYTQYMYNMNLVNPAYAGSHEALSIGTLYRDQWSGLDGAPKTFTFNAHTPMGENIGLGISVIADKIGPVKEKSLNLDYSYKIKLGGEHRLAFGLKAGATFNNIGLTGIIVENSGDPAFSSDVTDTYLNLGSGIYYYTNKYYVSFSVPAMLKSKHLDVNGIGYGSDVQHYFFTAGYVIEFNKSLKFKPSVMVKSAFSAPTSFDVNTNFLFLDRLEIGASYRLDDSFSGVVNFSVAPGIKIGYAYDHVISDIREAAAASHEVFIQFDIPYSSKVYRSPRYF